MKIISSCMSDHIFGIGQAILEKGHTFILWDDKNIPAFDIFSDIRPDVLIHEPTHIDRATIKCLDEFGTKTIITNDIPMCADVINYKEADPVDELMCDVVVIGICDYNKPIMKMISELCDIGSNKHVRIFGPTKWLFPQYQGSINNKDIGKILASTEEVIYTDDNNRALLYNILCLKGNCITDIDNPWCPVFNDTKARRLLTDNDIKSAIKNNHTCYHAADILLGFLR